MGVWGIRSLIENHSYLVLLGVPNLERICAASKSFFMFVCLFIDALEFLTDVLFFC